MITIFKFLTNSGAILKDIPFMDMREWGMFWSAIRIIIHCGFRHSDWVQFDSENDEFYFNGGVKCESLYKTKFYCIGCEKIIYEDKIKPQYVIP